MLQILYTKKRFDEIVLQNYVCAEGYANELKKIYSFNELCILPSPLHKFCGIMHYYIYYIIYIIYIIYIYIIYYIYYIFPPIHVQVTRCHTIMIGSGYRFIKLNP